MLADRRPEASPLTLELQTGDQPIVIETRDGAIHARLGSVENPDATLAGPVESAFVPREAHLGGRSVFVFAGLAHPASFEALVRGLQAKVAGVRWFRDHHGYSAADLRQLRREAAVAGAELLVTTEKDLMRLQPADMTGPPAIVAIPVDLRVVGGDQALRAALDEVLR